MLKLESLLISETAEIEKPLTKNTAYDLGIPMSIPLSGHTRQISRSHALQRPDYFTCWYICLTVCWCCGFTKLRHAVAPFRIQMTNFRALSI
jgi:hypothetical protein